MSTFKAKTMTPVTKTTPVNTPQADQFLLKNEGDILNSQVKSKKQQAPKRSFSVAYKTQILAAYDACENVEARGALLRKEGLYQARICDWRQQQTNGKNKITKTDKNAKRMDHLLSENNQLKKKMAQAQAVIELQKKVSDLLGVHILSLDCNEMS